MPTTKKQWTYLSNHAHLLVTLARNPSARVRDMAAVVGITERAVQRILLELQEAKVIAVTKVGRRNEYTINMDSPLRHSLEGHRTIGDLINSLE